MSVTVPPVDDPTCVCGHSAAAAHDIIRTPRGLQFGPCVKADCCCAAFNQRVNFHGDCFPCEAYWRVGLSLTAEWHIAPRAEKPSLSDQIARSLAMYVEHVVTHHMQSSG